MPCFFPFPRKTHLHRQKTHTHISPLWDIPLRDLACPILSQLLEAVLARQPLTRSFCCNHPLTPILFLSRHTFQSSKGRVGAIIFSDPIRTSHHKTTKCFLGRQCTQIEWWLDIISSGYTQALCQAKCIYLTWNQALTNWHTWKKWCQKNIFYIFQWKSVKWKGKKRQH